MFWFVHPNPRFDISHHRSTPSHRSDTAARWQAAALPALTWHGKRGAPPTAARLFAIAHLCSWLSTGRSLGLVVCVFLSIFLKRHILGLCQGGTSTVIVLIRVSCFSHAMFPQPSKCPFWSPFFLHPLPETKWFDAQ